MPTKTHNAPAALVTDMLREDHKKVQGLFKKFKKAETAKDKQQIVAAALLALEVHAELEEKLIYPAICSEIDAQDLDQELMEEALEEHHVVHGVIEELKKMNPDDERYDAKFTVLGEFCNHHIKEEEEEMLPQAECSDIDWDVLSAQVIELKSQLMENPGSSSTNGKNKTSKKKEEIGLTQRRSNS